MFVLPGQTIAKSEWPTLHKDYQRSGYTDEVVQGPYERKWYRDFHDEMIATRVEAIVAESKCYVGTFAGTMYGLDVTDGDVVWKFEAAGPIGASPCYEEDRLYFGADEGFPTGHLYCVNSADGSLVWKYDAGAGIWVSPACDGNRVYFGDRSGTFHAVSASTGERLWTLKTGAMILKPASLSPSGDKILFGSEDMHVYCVSPEGHLLWKSDKLEGLSMRDQGPTIWRGLAIVRTNPADSFHTVLGRNGDLLKQIQLSLPQTSEDKVLLDKWGDLIMHPTPRRREAEQNGIIEHLNAQIAGLLAGIRIMERGGESTVTERAKKRLAEMVTERMFHERADRWMIRPTKVASKGLHQAKIPRYVGLVPEVAAMLDEFASDELKANVEALMKGLSLWYQAFDERMIGGENYISPPHLAQGLFIAEADGHVLGAEQLAAKLDQPWCRADLYYIEKLSAILRRLDRVNN